MSRRRRYWSSRPSRLARQSHNTDLFLALVPPHICKTFERKPVRLTLSDGRRSPKPGLNQIETSSLKDVTNGLLIAFMLTVIFHTNVLYTHPNVQNIALTGFRSFTLNKTKFVRTLIERVKFDIVTNGYTKDYKRKVTLPLSII